ncbi:beta-glucosidase BglX [Flavobacterium johnsoniae]|uniref:beta-glucosidase n=1 Tax=Flavobacterium johnsoniae (strain ATCC 17061 / DSM 2064 / JCM 8514 / BCRC 14874 / CCUG 350202 / NBRC 14942 / NCIMB 11054 / UW101) TaxID=376686 RepID=A5FD44_FLAJ1|nr:beta-glucosidase BglX [Flavobacterium johnsoniae]ABQ06872.1 Candidate beta-glucosidase; Glycoside hydrolase family 3 [Flavobacterium johnsoniae UW101]OXE97268.1 beta-glucosidase [Flavobacterium johnsoniae UW101]WQG81294.1 beta-glucosidase BglX [Flavobacterium johnsoniae UW101]SHL38120.1 beta-glucosidase [Flavobacterium johnsoniae]
MKKQIKNYAFLLLAVSMNGYAQTKKHMDTKKPIEDRISLLMKEMTLEEKVGQMNQYNGSWDVTGPKPESGSNEEKYNNIKKGWVGSMLTVRGVKEVRAVQKIAVEETRLGIPLIFGFDVIHGYKTLSPIPLAEAASWDLEAIKNSARVAALEASASGLNWTFAPNVDISNDARWGRVMEGAGEDPYLGSKIATARVKGFQGESFSNTSIVACAKHFAAYGFVEAGREYNSVDMSNSKLYNTVLPPFKATVDAGIRTFMNSFNTLNGIPATGSVFLQRDILKGAWGFKGFVVSDWASIAEMITHGYAADAADAAKKAAIAGSDMDMESNVYVTELVQLVKKGSVKESVIDDAVRRILRVKFELGLFDDPYKYCDEAREKANIGSKANNDDVLDMAKKSIVLLKNDKNLLPLKKSGAKIALIGALANDKNSPLGSWRIAADDNTAVSVLEGMQQYKNSALVYEKGTDVALNKQLFVDEVKINTTDFSGFEAAKKAAKEAEVVVMVLGEIGFQSGEGRSRTELDLPGNQQQLLEEVYKVNPNIVLVLNNGRPLALPWAAEHIPAIVEAWQLGTQSGNAIAQVLYGDYNPSGKLPMSFPRNVGQCPIYYNLYNTGRPTDKDKNVFWSHYSDVEKTPLYPFGYGLSYTSFIYKNLKIAKPSFQKGEKIKVSVEVTNTGNFDGKEVVQLYINDPAASIVRPVKELKGFELIELKKGETKTVQFTLTDSALGFYDNDGKFLVEPGLFNVMVGWNSNDGLTTKFELK